MSASDLKVVETFYEKLNDSGANYENLEPALALIHPEFQLTEPASLPYGGVYRGREGLMKSTGRAAETLQIDIDKWELWDGGDHVFGMFYCTFHSKVTGRELVTTVLQKYRVEDGKIIDVDAYPKDTAAIVDLVRA